MTINELHITNFQNTGLTTPLPRYTFTIRINYTDDSGVARSHGPTTYTYPNDLAVMPLSVKRKFAIDMIVATARVALGVDTWEMYE